MRLDNVSNIKHSLLLRTRSRELLVRLNNRNISLPFSLSIYQFPKVRGFMEVD